MKFYYLWSYPFIAFCFGGTWWLMYRSRWKGWFGY